MPFRINIRVRKPSNATKPDDKSPPQTASEKSAEKTSEKVSETPASDPAPAEVKEESKAEVKEEAKEEPAPAPPPIPPAPVIIATADDSTKRVPHPHISHPPPTPTYDKVLLTLIGTNILWALIYVAFLLVRLLGWLIAKLEEGLTQVMAAKFEPPRSLNTFGRLRNFGADEGMRKGLDERMPIGAASDSEAWMVHAPDGRCMECIIRQRGRTG